MVDFWREMRKRELKVCQDRIQFAEKHGNGGMAISEKARLLKLKKMISDRDT